MRACFLGQNVCALGKGIAVLQIPPLPNESREPTFKPDLDHKSASKKAVKRPGPKGS
jgi:hypothetical protein